MKGQNRKARITPTRADGGLLLSSTWVCWTSSSSLVRSATADEWTLRPTFLSLSVSAPVSVFLPSESQLLRYAHQDSESKMRFSQRIGETPIRDSLQIESMDSDLRNSLWNVLHSVYMSGLDLHTLDGTRQQRFFERLWRDFFKKQVDNIPKYSSDAVERIKEWFFNAEWYEVYDLIEFVAKHDAKFRDGKFEDVCNTFLEREMSGYRFLDNVLVKITNENELAEIEGAIKKSQQTKLSGVNEHLKTALSKLSDRKEPDYRNSIKESISAVESISIVISGDDNATLGQALRVLEDKVDLHPALKSGFSSIYGYTSDEDGIRHALTESSSCDFEDAKYMLVSCSAFINYLISKARKAGINLE